MPAVSQTPTGAFRAENDAAALDACLAEIAENSPSALAELYRRTSAAVYGFALSILKNTHDAEDVLHDCYVGIYSAAASYRSEGKPMAWVLTIARNLCLLKLRERGKAAELSEEDWARQPAPEYGPDAEDRLVLEECMKSLTDEERQIVTLHAVAGFRHREIAQALELPLPTVLSKYSRAIKKLKKRLMKGERQG